MSRCASMIMAAALIAAMTVHSPASAQGVFQTVGTIMYLTYFGRGGPQSGETIVGSKTHPVATAGTKIDSQHGSDIRRRTLP